MATIITRQTAATGVTVKGSPFTKQELDQNFINLNSEVYVDNYPVARPTLLLDFVNNDTLDSRITFERTSGATRFNSSGVLETVSNNIPRFDYDPITTIPRGLLIEELRTNLFRYSESFRTHNVAVTITSGTFINGETVTATGNGTGVYISSESTATDFVIFNGSGTFSGTLTGGTSGATATITSSVARWNLTNASVTANADTSPDGTTTADKLIENNLSGVHRVFSHTIGTTAATPYTVSVFAKAAERNLLAIELRAAVSLATFTFNLTTGGVTGSATGCTTRMEPLKNGWYRCSVMADSTVTTTGSGMALFYIIETANNSYVGNGTSGLLLWGAQFEEGAFPTSYIRTTDSTSTRNPDNVTMTGTNFTSWYNPVQGTMFAQSKIIGTGQINACALLISRGGIGTSDNAYVMSIRHSASNFSFARGTVSDLNGLAIVDLNASSVTEDKKYAMSYIKDNFRFSVNGSTPIVDTLADPPGTNAIQAFIGANTFNTNRFNGWIGRVSYYPVWIPDAQLQAITI